MAQRTVMRMNWAQMSAMTNELASTPAPPVPSPAPPSNSIHYVTEHITKANDQGCSYKVVLGPSKSTKSANAAILRLYPRAAGLVESGQSTPFAHIRWKEDNGVKVLVELVEEKDNAAVYASPANQELFFIMHRITDYDDEPVCERGSLEGTHTTMAAANEAAMKLFMVDIAGNTLEERKEVVKEDRTVICTGYRASHGGCRWIVEVVKCTWDTR